MSELKATPGPWDVVNGTDVFTNLGAANAGGARTDGDDGWHIADCNPGGSFVDGHMVDMILSERQRNAYLIAAAPELLEALESLIESIKIDTSGNMNGLFDACLTIDDVRAARAAIAKARGES